jgi:ABC-type glycerol-3-phosphate transport system substrate-binding protein
MRHLFSFLFILGLMGCTTLPAATETLPLPSTPTQTPPPSLTVSPTDSPTNPEPTGPVTIQIWLPPQFDPASESPEGVLLNTRLDEFATRRSDLEIETRIKNVDGFGGILDTLSTASSAAPNAMPDLVALPRHAMETAVTKGLLHSFDGLIFIMDDPDWYGYARQLSRQQNITYGIPFAGDGMLLVYRPEIIETAPLDWTATLAITQTLTFPAADPSAIFTLAQYQAIGGPVLTENDQPMLEPFQLTEVFSYYHQANQSALMPGWLTQFESDSQAWEAYQTGEADLAITWASRYLEEQPGDSLAGPIPTADGVPFTFADGWVWALTTQDPDRQLIAAQLVEFLTVSEFMAAWTEAAGLMPPRPSAVTLWGNAVVWNLLGQISTSAQLVPPLDVVASLGPVLQPSVIGVLRAEMEPTAAVQSSIEKLIVP